MFGFGFDKKRGLVGDGVESFPQPFINAGSFTAGEETIINTFGDNLELGLVNGNNLITDVFTDGYIYPIIGSTAVNHALNLIDPTKYLIMWINSPVHSATGVKGTGTQFAETAFIPEDNMTIYDTTQSCYKKSDEGGTKLFMGSSGLSGDFLLWESNATIACLEYTSGTPLSASTTAVGLITGVCRANNDRELYKYGASVASTSNAVSGALPEIEDYLMCRNLDGSPSLNSSDEFRLFAKGKAMNFSQLQDWNAAILAFQTSLSRNV